MFEAFVSYKKITRFMFLEIYILATGNGVCNRFIHVF